MRARASARPPLSTTSLKSSPCKQQPTVHAQPARPWGEGDDEEEHEEEEEEEVCWAGWAAHSLEDLHDDDESLLPIARAGGHSLQHILQLHNVLCAQNRTQRLEAEQAAADDG